MVEFLRDNSLSSPTFQPLFKPFRNVHLNTFVQPGRGTPTRVGQYSSCEPKPTGLHVSTIRNHAKYKPGKRFHRNAEILDNEM